MNQKIITTVTVCLMAFALNAQQKLEKTAQTVKTTKDVTLNLDTSHTTIEIETWDKNQIDVKAFIESNELSKEELQDVLNNWKVTVKGSGDNVTISTSGNYGYSYNYSFINNEVHDALNELKFAMADLPEMPEMPDLPEMPELNFDVPEMPELPELPELPEGVHSVNFDSKAYEKEGEAYLERWSQEYEEKYGKEYKDKMKAWAKEFSKIDFDNYSARMEAWGKSFGEKFDKKYAKEFEKWGEEFGKKFDEKWAKDMEKWGEEFGKKFEARMEKRTEELDKRLKAREEQLKARTKEREARLDERTKELEERMRERESRRAELRDRIHSIDDSKVKRTLKIKMPKDTKLKVDIRHGDLKFSSVLFNVRGELSHSKLVAQSIDGPQTSINASYSTIFVKNWNNGELKINYVEDAILQNVTALQLDSNSSNIGIDYLKGSAIIVGSFGDLTIHQIMDSFNNLNITLENSDAAIKLPKVNHSLTYKGNRTRFTHPNKTNKENSTSFTDGPLNSGKTIVLTAKYSNVIMQ